MLQRLLHWGTRLLEWCAADMIFFRVCMFVSGSGLFFGLTWVVLRAWPIQEFWVWFFVVPFGVLGFSMMLLPLLASDQAFARWVELIPGDLSDFPGVLFLAVLALLAIPLTALIRWKKSFRR
ncbi:MAG: hypothetical protein LBO00_00045 [Zoogloeaceae bacterium]|nr:hypothetical protein [Zoogloeaceae bacterium]